MLAGQLFYSCSTIRIECNVIAVPCVVYAQHQAAIARNLAFQRGCVFVERESFELLHFSGRFRFGRSRSVHLGFCILAVIVVFNVLQIVLHYVRRVGVRTEAARDLDVIRRHLVG